MRQCLCKGLKRKLRNAVEKGFADLDLTALSLTSEGEFP